MQAMPEMRGLYGKMASIKERFVICLGGSPCIGNQNILERSQREPQSNRNNLSRIKLTCNHYSALRGVAPS